MLVDISSNIATNMKIDKMSVANMPENVTGVSFGHMDENGNFVEEKRLRLGVDVFIHDGSLEFDTSLLASQYSSVQVQYISMVNK